MIELKKLPHADVEDVSTDAHVLVFPPFDEEAYDKRRAEEWTRKQAIIEQVIANQREMEAREASLDGYDPPASFNDSFNLADILDLWPAEPDPNNYDPDEIKDMLAEDLYTEDTEEDL